MHDAAGPREVKNNFRLVSAGDSALIVEFEERIDPAVNARAIAVADSIRAAAIAGIRDVVATYRSVAVYFDPLSTNYDALVASLERGAAQPVVEPPHRVPIRIPVCYGGELGPDIARVAEFGQMSEPDVVALHSGASYRVFMLGFVPGFAYMGIVDARIAVPRRSTPRVRVPQGSVGIAGAQTGIYPAETPAGWQLIGRTPVTLFDLSRPEPFLLNAGDAVQFYPIDRGQFDRLREGNR
jgi:inhibitor of KinA